MGHSNVKLTWDQTDQRRAEMLKRGFMMGDDVDGEYEKKYYSEFLAPPTDEEDNREEAQPKDIEDYRNKLLTGLTEDKGKSARGPKEEVDAKDIDWDAVNSDELNSEDLDQIEQTGKLDVSKSKQGPEIKFSTGFGENIGEKLIKNKQEKKEKAGMTEFEKW